MGEGARAKNQKQKEPVGMMLLLHAAASAAVVVCCSGATSDCCPSSAACGQPLRVAARSTDDVQLIPANCFVLLRQPSTNAPRRRPPAIHLHIDARIKWCAAEENIGLML